MIKLIAMVTMLIDHIGLVFFPDMIWFRIVGRLAFPLFAWGIARGYRYTRNYKIYALRLLVLGLVSQVPYTLLFGNEYLNVCFTLLGGLLVLKLYDSKRLLLPVKLTGIAALLLLSHFANFEYGIYGVLTILFFYIFWDNKKVFAYQGILTLVSTVLYRYHVIQLLSVLSSFLTVNYREYDFKLNRFVQYGFYPIHILVLLILQSVVN
jgi:hypothetical protein